MTRFQACPGSPMMDFRTVQRETTVSQEAEAPPDGATAGKAPSELGHWPIQMHLISPAAPYFQGADVVLAADCTAYALGSFHADYLKGRSLVIACPKLDSGLEVYAEKLRALVEDARINTLTVVIMQVPCCRGLVALTQRALADAGRKVPVKAVVVGIQGEILSEEWL